MKPLPALLALALAACSTARERDVDRHFRHHANSALLEDLKIVDARTEANRTCGGPVELIEGKDGLAAADYRCAPKPQG